MLLLNPHAHVVSPCYADEVFSKSALQKLEAAGFNVHMLLADVYSEFVVDAIGITADVRDEFSAEKSIANVFDYWLTNDGLRRPPTWRSLLDVPCELGLGELSQQIEEYFTDGR